MKEQEPIPVKYEGVISIGEYEIRCYVLENGLRVLSGRGMQEALKMVDTEEGKRTSGTRLARYFDQKSLNPFIFSDKDSGHFDPILCKHQGKIIHGYEATVLADICEAFLEARKHITLSPRQAIIAEQCEILIRAFAKVGIVALVDEATGYNKDKLRAKDELQKFLQTILNDEASRWVKTFQDEFFEMIYRMRGWNWTSTSKRPAVVGTWINDIIYERLAPAVLATLREKNPKNEKGNRSHRHHQYLTQTEGLPMLKEHIAGIMAIGRLSGNSWEVFMKNIDKAYPKQYQQLYLDFDD